MGLAALPSWMSAALVAVGATDAANLSKLAAIESTLNAHSFMPQWNTGCATVKFRLYEGPLVTTICGGAHQSVDFNAVFNTYDIEAGGQWAWIPRGSSGTGGPGGGGTGTPGSSASSAIFFQLRNTPGQQVVTLSDPTFVVKAVIPVNVFFGSTTNPDPNFAHTTDPGSFCNFALGVDDGHGGAAGFANAGGPFLSGDNTVYCSSNAYSISGCQNIAILINARRFLGRVIDVSSPGQFTIDMVTANGGNVWCEAVVIGGAGVQAVVLPFGPPASTGLFTGPAVGFTPIACIALGIKHPPGSDIRSAGSYAAFGWSVKCDGIGSCTAASDIGNQNGNTQAASYQRASRLCAIVDPTGAGSAVDEIAVTAWNANDVTINVIARAGAYYELLFLGGVIAANAGVFTQGDTVIPYKIKKPRVMITASIGKMAGTTVRRDAYLDFGMMAHPEVGKFNTHNLGCQTKDAVSPAFNVSKKQDILGSLPLEPVATVSLWEVPEPSNLLLGHGLITSMNPQVAPVTWTIDDGGLREVAYLLLGDDATGITPCGDADVVEELAVACAAGNGAVGVPYASAFVATGGTEPYAFAITSGGVPSGLTLNAVTGDLSGVPIAAGLFTLTIRVTDDNDDTATHDCEILITEQGDCIPPPGASVAGARLVPA
jgi:hypothetical protein